MKVEQALSKAPGAATVLLAGALVINALADQDGRAEGRFETPKTVTVGAQKWATRNLDVANFNNGDVIREATTAEQWLAAHRDESPAWCFYNNDPKNGEKFGRLYNWYAVDDNRGLCPAGWRVPTDREWQSLLSHFGSSDKAFEDLAQGDSFAARAAGARWFEDASFNHKGGITFWWSATKHDKWNAWYHAMHFELRQVGRDYGGMNTGHSVRCVKDNRGDDDDQ